jgi:hypothetical protein
MDCAGGNETHTDGSRDYLMATKAKRVLILGGGFGGIYAALKLEKLLRRHDDLEVTLPAHAVVAAVGSYSVPACFIPLAP